MSVGDTARHSSRLAGGPVQSKSALCLTVTGWVPLFLVLLAWTVREVIGGFLRGGSRLAEDIAYCEAAVACACHPKRKRRLGGTYILVAVSYYGTKAPLCGTKGCSWPPLARIKASG